MIFGMRGTPMNISRCSSAECSMKPAIAPPCSAGRIGLPMFSWLAGSSKMASSPIGRQRMPSSRA
ncbi:hypothetical protein D3C80_2124990 [compost metagenome]